MTKIERDLSKSRGKGKAQNRKYPRGVATREARQQREKVSRGQLSDVCYNIRGRNRKDVQKDNFTE